MSREIDFSKKRPLDEATKANPRGIDHQGHSASCSALRDANLLYY